MSHQQQMNPEHRKLSVSDDEDDDLEPKVESEEDDSSEVSSEKVNGGFRKDGEPQYKPKKVSRFKHIS